MIFEDGYETAAWRVLRKFDLAMKINFCTRKMTASEANRALTHMNDSGLVASMIVESIESELS